MSTFTLSTVIGLLIAYGVVALIMFILNTYERVLDKKLSILEEMERQAAAAKRKQKKSPAAAAGSADKTLVAAAVAAVQQFRAENEK